jgi:TM2 domain-containing membrane protein YozV
MRVNIKAALLSALVLPGLGQLYKGCKLKGGVMIALVNVFLLAALFVAMQGIGKIMLSVSGSGVDGMEKVLQKMQKDTPTARWLLAAFFGLWLYGVIDALLNNKDE